MNRKYTVRVQMLARRRRLSVAEQTGASAQICWAVVRLLAWRQARTVCIYCALGSEVDTTILLEQKKTFVVVEPKPLQLPETLKADLFIVPGVAFDREGYRLGRGKGYYDRLLKDVTAPKIGLAYSFQIVPRLPHNRYDIPMDIVVTESGIVIPAVEPGSSQDKNMDSGSSPE